LRSMYRKHEQMNLFEARGFTAISLSIFSSQPINKELFL